MMKKLTLPLLYAVFSCLTSSAQPGVCPGSAVFLTTQAQVNQFPIDWPNCQVLQSRFEVGTINGSTDITDLTPLSNLTGSAFQKSFYVHYNPLLTSLNGLQNLANMGGDLTIEANPLLTDLQGLGGIQTIDGIIKVQNNDGLLSLNGLSSALTVVESIVVIENDVLQNLNGVFDNLQTVDEYVFINSNPQLPTFNTLNNVTSIGWYLNIEHHPSLVSLNAFNSLQSVGMSGAGWDFEVIDCPNLTTLNDFANLSQLGKDFDIHGNTNLISMSFPSLTSINAHMIISDNDALTTIVPSFPSTFTIGSTLTITGNNLLSQCEADAFCAHLDANKPATITGNATGCANITQVKNACEAAPIELVFFTGKEYDGDVLLSWKTASEESNDHFQVEHSTDGKVFRPVGQVAGNGTTTSPNSYSFRHTRPAKGANYYRLKQVDFDGEFSYSNIVHVEMGNGMQVEAYPNPTSSFLKLKGELSEGTARLLDLDGRPLAEKQLPDSRLFDLTRLPKGVYFLEIVMGSERIVKRVVKE